MSFVMKYIYKKKLTRKFRVDFQLVTKFLVHIGLNIGIQMIIDSRLVHIFQLLLKLIIGVFEAEEKTVRCWLLLLLFLGCGGSFLHLSPGAAKAAPPVSPHRSGFVKGLPDDE